MKHKPICDLPRPTVNECWHALHGLCSDCKEVEKAYRDARKRGLNHEEACSISALLSKVRAEAR